MAFKRTGKAQGSVESPEALFRDLRNRSVQGLLSQQADMLREYAAAADEPDLALQLPTGSGKTLVGLLIAEWRRRRNGERAAFLCPTKQLVHQVVAQSVEYGIRTVALVGSQKNFDPKAKGDYRAGDVLAVATYSALFNTHPFFDDAGVLVLDDAHAAENYVAAFWSVEIRSGDDADAYRAVTEFLRPVLAPSDYARMTGSTSRSLDTRWVDAVPIPHLSGRLADFVALLDQQLGESAARFSWSVVRDHITACQVFISKSAIVIRPPLPPTAFHPAFTSPKQRVYMSATLGAAGELERLWGREKIRRLPVPRGWDKQGIGRRLFFFPERSLDDSDTKTLVTEMIRLVPRALVLAPDHRTVSQLLDQIGGAVGGDLFRAADLEETKDPFVTSNRAIAFFANRYDGVDLADDDCRLLVVYGLPQAMNLHEAFVVTCFGASIFLIDRFLTRISQAVGRCTRSATDYSAVILVGEELINFLLRLENRRLLHPEMQGELEFGIEQSKDMKQGAFIDNLEIFLSRGDAWDAAESDILGYRDAAVQMQLPAADKLCTSAPREVRYQNALWQGDYGQALDEARGVLGHLAGEELKGYRAYWNYLAGCAAWLSGSSSEPIARDYFARASKIVSTLRWLPAIARGPSDGPSKSDDEDGLLAAQVLGIEQRLAEIGTVTATKFEAQVKAIQNGLADNSAKPFEAGMVSLGELLGFTAENSDDDAAPDPWWRIDDRYCMVFEAHTDKVSGSDALLGANKVRQAKSHPDWIRKNVPGAEKARVTAVLVTPCTRMTAGATPHVAGVYYWEMKTFRQWAAQALGVIRELWRNFPGPGDLAWRAEAMTKLKEARLDVRTLDSNVHASPLAAVPVQK
jgi:hypothetical protein